MLQIRIILLKTKFIMLLVSILTLIAAVLCPHINNNIHQSPAVSSLTSYVVAALGLSSSSKTLNILTPKLPQGTNRILDRRYFSKKDWNGYSDPKSGKDDSNSIFNKERRLKRYENYDIVNCLDSLFVKRNRSFYITFIGDSLMRNQFKNFLEVCVVDQYIECIIQVAIISPLIVLFRLFQVMIESLPSIKQILKPSLAITKIIM